MTFFYVAHQLILLFVLANTVLDMALEWVVNLMIKLVRIQFHLAVKLLAASHALHLALWTFKLRVLCGSSLFFVHFPVFFNVRRYFNTLPIIFNPFLNFWEINELGWIAFAFRRVIVRLDVIESSRKLDLNLTFFMDGRTFRIWPERRIGCWNARFLNMSGEWRHTFLKNLFAFFLIIPVTALAWRNLNKYLSWFLLI